MKENAPRRLWPWIFAVIALPVLYVASFGPACWLARDHRISLRIVAESYRPVIRVANASPVPIRNAMTAYSGNRDFAFSLLDQPGMLGVLTEILDGKLRVK